MFIYELIIGILIIFIVILVCILIKERINEKEIIKKRLEKEYLTQEEQYRKNFNKLKFNYNEEIEKIRKEFQVKQKEYDDIILRNEKFIKNEEAKKNLILKQKKEIIEKELNEYKILEENKINEDLKLKKENANELLNSFKNNINEEREKINNEIIKIKEELEEYRSKRATVNEAILREKRIQELEDFYRINLLDADIDDIKTLKSIEYNLKNHEVLNKIIYEMYIKRPLNEMIKRVCPDDTSGIYKITYIPTGESYIGRTTSIHKRFTEHVKSSFNIGSIAHSSLHTKMAKDGVWNFTFEVLEEVKKDELNEREKFWIDVYDTKKYGLNIKEGG